MKKNKITKRDVLNVLRTSSTVEGAAEKLGVTGLELEGFIEKFGINRLMYAKKSRIGSVDNPMRVKIKKLTKDSVIPTYAHVTDAGMDLYASSCGTDEYGNMVYGTGIAVEIPRGYVGLLFPRSSITNTLMVLGNCVGVIDSGYRGEITFKFHTRLAAIMPKRFVDRVRYILNGYFGDKTCISATNLFSHTQYNIGDRIGQLIIIPYPKVEFVEVDELSSSDRGTGSYGSSGK